MNTLRHLKISAFLFLLSVPFIARGEGSGPSGKINNPLESDNLVEFINSIIDAAMKLGAILAVLAVIYAGFKFVTAQGDPKAISTAKAILLYTVIGVIILLGARVIAEVIINTIEGIDG
jgi:hypothetical protein